MAKRPDGSKETPGLKYGAEALGLILFALAVVSAVSLVTHDPRDPISFGATGPFHNALKLCGAWFSFVMMDILGAASFALPFFFVLWGIYQFRGGVTWTRMFRLATFWLGMFLVAALLSLTVIGEDESAVHAAVARGGAVGLLLADAVFYLVGKWFGMAIVLIIMVPVLAWAVAGVSPRRLWMAAAAAASWLAGRWPRPEPEVEGEDVDKGVAFETEAGERPVAEQLRPPDRVSKRPPEETTQPHPAARVFRKEATTTGYRLPPLDLLTPPAPSGEEVSADYLNECKKKLEAAFQAFRIDARVREIRRGPRLSRFEVELAPGQKFGAVKAIEEDLARSVAVPGITVTSVASRGVVAVDIPNPVAGRVYLRGLLATNAFKAARQRLRLAVAVGRRQDGQILAADLTKMPHLLVAGATGSGKSMFLNAVVMSLLMTNTPETLRLVMIDPKRLDLSEFKGIPHRCFEDVVITELADAQAVLRGAVALMEDRYRVLARAGARNIESYNQTPGAETLPYVVIVVDEFNDLMTRDRARKVEECLVRLAQMARAVGIHLVVATQRPSVDVITGVIKANFPSRVAFNVSSQVDSRTILDRPGAEHLLPEGDMLFFPAGAAEPERVQGVFVGDDEIKRVVSFWAEQPMPPALAGLADAAGEAPHAADAALAEEDELFDEAAALVVSSQMASVSMLQRRFRIGFARAGRLIDMMERRGIVGPGEGAKPRKVLIKTLEELKGLTGENEVNDP